MFAKFYRVQLFLYVLSFVIGALFQVIHVGGLPSGVVTYADAGLPPPIAILRVAATGILALCLFFPALAMLRDAEKVPIVSIKERWTAHAFLLLTLSLWVGTFPFIILYGGTWHIINTLLGAFTATAALRTSYVLARTHDEALSRYISS